MKHLKTWWLLIVVLFALPYGFVFVAGTVWLYEQHALWYWIAATAVVTLGGLGVAGWLRAKSLEPIRARVEPNPEWSPQGQTAWRRVEQIAARAKAEPIVFDDLEAWSARLLRLLREVLEAVAAEYHPGRRHAALEVPVPQVLAIVELAARDLRHQIERSLPLSHVLTLNDLLRLPQLGVWTRRLYAAYRVLRFGVNPLAAIPREVVDAMATKYQHTTLEQSIRWALGYYVEKVGYYAIQLYSGHLVTDDETFDRYVSGRSARDLVAAEARRTMEAGEPLRILVLGQVKAGKSSLINALFGEVRSATDVLPRTRNVQPFAIEIEGARQAVILDTAGYDDPDAAAVERIEREILHSDLVLLVVSAVSAARAADRRLVDHLRQLFQSHPERSMPPLLLVVTHVDLLRPVNQWNPPYDLRNPTDAKARNICAALDAVANDLDVPPEAAIPVCLLPDRLYNIDEGLVPAMLRAMPEAQRARCLRALPQFRRARDWELLWQQAVNSGRLLIQLGLRRYGASASKSDDAATAATPRENRSP